ncbi:MAG: M28 family peptidase [Alphaproteobacteria bacterium]|nr:M28 family peptidase [Alphaproteobacteria bacterium]
MQGRDIGSPGHQRAAEWVAARFKAAGLKPAGDNGTWFQSFPVHDVRVDSARAAVVRKGGRLPLRFLWDFSVRAADDLPARIDAPMVFAGYCRAQDLTGARGRIAVCINTRRAGLTSGAERLKNAQAAGAVGLIQVDDPGFTIEPFRWPQAYARTVTLAETPPAPTHGFVAMTLSARAFAAMARGSGHDGAKVLADGGAKRPLPVFDLPGRFTARFTTSRRDERGVNVLAALPGSDPKLAGQTLVLGAHLDGYGFGTPVKGDNLYNGTLDDAAYVGTLIRFAERRAGRPMRRTVVFAAFDGEEKGLLGSTWFTRHPTVPKASLAADINLDQLRPLFPLKLLTVLALDDTTLGDTVRQVAAARGIAVQPDPEPERALLRRADHWPFMKIGVPATGFIFGFRPGTDAERRYREWYRVRYHRPQDDLTQPMDFKAAGDFNRFFYQLAESVADAPQAPAWKPGSPYAPKRTDPSSEP